MEDTKPKDDTEQLPAKDKPIPQKNQAVEDARQIVERMETANKESKEILARQESLEAERVISGQADAGQIPDKPKEETDKEYSERIMRGDLKDGEGQ